VHDARVPQATVAPWFVRFVRFVMMPASLTPPWLLAEKLKAYENKYENLVHGGKKLKEKLKAYEKLVTTSHWPN
jgi:hypothetical protein